MEVILLEKINKLGSIGDIVKVKDGFGRNYLIPKKKAARATKDNIAFFAQKKQEFEARNAEILASAQQIAASLENLVLETSRQSGDDGRLFGSITSRDIVSLLKEKDIHINKEQVNLINPVKYIGQHELKIDLHADLTVSMHINVVRAEIKG